MEKKIMKDAFGNDVVMYKDPKGEFNSLPKPEYLADLTPEHRRADLDRLFDEYDIQGEEREALYVKYSC